MLVIADGSIIYEGKRLDENDFEVKLSDIKEVNVNGIMAKNHGLEPIGTNPNKLIAVDVSPSVGTVTG